VLAVLLLVLSLVFLGLDAQKRSSAQWVREKLDVLQRPVLFFSDLARHVERFFFVLHAYDAILIDHEKADVLAQLHARDRALVKASLKPPSGQAVGALHLQSASIVAHRVHPLHHELWVTFFRARPALMQPVFSSSGLLGHVSAIEGGRARVTLLDDVSSKVPVFTRLKTVRGVVFGEGSGQDFSLNYIPLRAPVRVGDVLMTSGLGGVYPRAYPVAQIVSIKRAPNTPFLQIKARPYADAYRHFYVFFSANQTRKVDRTISVAR
jgi:hypothetical protein